jgi:hypothetical protein
VILAFRAIALGIGEPHDRGELAIAVTVTENQHRKKWSLQFVQMNRQDLASNELLVMLAFDVGGMAHAASPT